MKIYIDFDRTHFNTDLFIKDLNIIKEKYHISEELFQKYSLKTHEKQGFNPLDILKQMEKEVSIDKRIYNDIEELFLHDKKYLYDDVIDFLKKAKKKNYKIILLTRGNYAFQIKKIQNTAILEFFDDVLVILKHKGELNLDYDTSIFIDDNIIELESIMTRNPKRIIQIQRDSSEKINNNFEIVYSLKDIII